MVAWLLGCVGWHQIPAHPGPPEAPPEVVAYVGATASPPPTGLLADLTQQGVQALVLVGDAVPASHPRAWTQVSKRWESLPALDVVGPGERRGDPDLLGRSAVWPGSPTWGSWPVGNHRLVWLDTTDPVDQRFWLPKGVTASKDGAVVVALGEPSASLESQVFDAVDAAAMALLVRGSAAGNSASLPNGRWSYLVLDVGPTSGGVSAWIPGGESFHDALVTVFKDEYPAAEARLTPTSSLSGPFAPAGWWKVTLADDVIDVGFRRRGTDGVWHLAYEASWSRSQGWTERPAALP
jgi:hypothetical protein